MFIIIKKEGSEIIKRLKEYPNIKNIKIVGFDYDNFDIYIKEDQEAPIYDSNIKKLEEKEIFTEDLHPDYENVKICKNEYVITELSDNVVINKLNYELGNYLDDAYPLWERIKHISEYNNLTKIEKGRILTPDENDIVEKLQFLYDWVKDCRKLRDEKEKEYKETKKITNFNNWLDKPLKP